MLLSAILIGLAGGMHCGLMCGPLQIAVFGKQKLGTSYFTYQLGRISTYMLIGALFFGLGKGVSLLGLQEVFVYLIIIYVLLFYVFPKSWIKHLKLHKIDLLPFQAFSSLLKKRKNKNKLLFKYLSGILNGLLPCGLVYVAAANSLLATDIFYNQLSMFLFGISTLPWLVGSKLLTIIPFKVNNVKMNKLRPYLAVVVVFFLLSRTIDLPFLHNENTNQSEKTITSCGGSPESFFWKEN